MKKYLSVAVLLVCMVVVPFNSHAAAQKSAVSSGSTAGIKVLAPNGGESLLLGKRYPIQWKFSSVSGNIRIDLYKNKKFVGTITKSCPISKKRYTWTAGRLTKGTARAGNGYILRIGTIDKKYKDYSNKPFTLAAQSSSAASSTSHAGVVSGSSGTSTLPPSTAHSTGTVTTPVQRKTKQLTNVQSRGMTVEGTPVAKGDLVRRTVNLHFTNPKGGEVWERGKTYTIRWDKIGGIGNVKILLKDLLNQSALWVSQGDNNVIKNTGYYNFQVPTTLPDSAYEFHIMAPNESYKNTSKKFYLGRTDTDLFVRGANIGKSRWNDGTVYKQYVKIEIWLKNKGTRPLNSVKVNWQVVKEPLGESVEQGEKVFKNMRPDTWYHQGLKIRYDKYNHTTEERDQWGRPKEGEAYVMKFEADPGNTLGELDLVRNNNVYQTEILNSENY